MPELPEVECLRRSLIPRLIGARVEKVSINRRDVCRSFRSESGAQPRQTVTPSCLLQGALIVAIERHGKQLALLAEDGRALCVQLGMTGTLTMHRDDQQARKNNDPHEHVIWRTDRGDLCFRDPRRFGKLRACESFALLRSICWKGLGPDALTISGPQLADSLHTTRRAVKAALLDQRTLAGVGNIYADEALFRARINPMKTSCLIDDNACGRIAACIRSVLALAVDLGGSTLRDYHDADGSEGSMQREFAVYGRAGKACIVCGERLRRGRVAQRTTVWCRRCQKERRERSTP